MCVGATPTKGLLVGRRVKVVADLRAVRAEPDRFLDVVQDHPLLRGMKRLGNAALDVSEGLVDGVCPGRYVSGRVIHMLQSPQHVRTYQQIVEVDGVRIDRVERDLKLANGRRAGLCQCIHVARGVLAGVLDCRPDILGRRIQSSEEGVHVSQGAETLGRELVPEGGFLLGNPSCIAKDDVQVDQVRVQILDRPFHLALDGIDRVIGLLRCLVNVRCDTHQARSQLLADVDFLILEDAGGHHDGQERAGERATPRDTDIIESFGHGNLCYTGFWKRVTSCSRLSVRSLLTLPPASLYLANSAGRADFLPAFRSCRRVERWNVPDPSLKVKSTRASNSFWFRTTVTWKLTVCSA